jgi:hypothetical protein
MGYRVHAGMVIVADGTDADYDVAKDTLRNNDLDFKTRLK